MDSRAVEIARSGERDNDHRDALRDFLPQGSTKAFSDAAFDSISHDGIADSARYGNSEPPLRRVSELSRVQHEMLARNAGSFALEAQELGATMQPVDGGEALRRAARS